MQIKQIRNATLKINYAGKTFLIDPWLVEKNKFGSFEDVPRFPFQTRDKVKNKIPAVSKSEKTAQTKKIGSRIKMPATCGATFEKNSSRVFTVSKIKVSSSPPGISRRKISSCNFFLTDV